MLALVQAMLAGKTDAQALRNAGQREALAPVHRGMGGGIIDPTSGKEAGNAFNNGTFLGADERAARETAVLGGGRLGLTGMQLQNAGRPPVSPGMAAAAPTMPAPSTFIPPQTAVGAMQAKAPYPTGTKPQPKNTRTGASFGFGASAAPRSVF